MLISEYLNVTDYWQPGRWNIWYFSSESAAVAKAAEVCGQVLETSRGQVWRVMQRVSD